jgi:hypothetical protein
MISVYGENVSSYKIFVQTFQWGRESIQSNPRPVEARTNENIKKVEVLVSADRRIRVSMIANEVEIPGATVLKILHEDLGMNKNSARWIPKLLNPE